MMEFVETTFILYDSYQFISLVIPRVSDMCTDETCPEMTAGHHYSYVWTDFSGGNPTPVRLL